ncbi:MAG: hypothetical protein VCE75_28115 [Alphaproteobacteria bacterium]
MSTISEEEQHRRDWPDLDRERDQDQFAEYVQLHTIEDKVMSRDDEKKILEAGLTRFGLDFREARGILLSVASERKIALVSHVEHHIGTFLQQVAKREKVSRQDFNKAAMLYRKMANDSISDIKIRGRIKQMIENQGWTGRRGHWLLGSKRWYKKI